MFDLLKWDKFELGVVASVILVVFGISFYQLQISRMKTRDAQRKSDTELVAKSLEAYYQDYRVYPLAGDGGVIVSCGSKGVRNCVWGDDRIVDEDNIAYLEHVPNDPFADFGYRYIYEVSSDRQHYKIYSALEYRGDKDSRSDLTVECALSVKCRWYAGR